MYVEEYMTKSPTSITTDTTIPKAREILQEKDFRHLPVVDLQERLCGMVTDRDIRSAYPSSVLPHDEWKRLYKELETKKVHEIMSTKLVTLSPNCTLDDALILLKKYKVGAIPVVDASMRLIGILSIRDLMAAYSEIFGLDEKGSTLLELRDDPERNSIRILIDILTKKGMELSRLVKIKKKALIYVRINTYNVRGLLEALRKEGIEPVLPKTGEKK